MFIHFIKLYLSTSIESNYKKNCFILVTVNKSMFQLKCSISTIDRSVTTTLIIFYVNDIFFFTVPQYCTPNLLTRRIHWLVDCSGLLVLTFRADASQALCAYSTSKAAGGITSQVNGIGANIHFKWIFWQFLLIPNTPYVWSWRILHINNSSKMLNDMQFEDNEYHIVHYLCNKYLSLYCED